MHTRLERDDHLARRPSGLMEGKMKGTRSERLSMKVSLHCYCSLPYLCRRTLTLRRRERWKGQETENVFLLSTQYLSRSVLRNHLSSKTRGITSLCNWKPTRQNPYFPFFVARLLAARSRLAAEATAWLGPCFLTRFSRQAIQRNPFQYNKKHSLQ
jgi:hypothetical protein